MTQNSQYIMLLRTLVEETADHRISSSTDFAYLSGCIQGRLKETLSVSTLERIWGYVEGYQTIRESTLDVLARFVGFPDWKSFVTGYCEVPSAQSSMRIVAGAVPSSDIPEGGRLAIEWNPGRHVELLHLGGGQWRVEASVNSKLAAGDTFRCERFIPGQTLLLDNYRHGGEEPGLFAVGRRGGLTLVEQCQATPS